MNQFDISQFVTKKPQQLSEEDARKLEERLERIRHLKFKFEEQGYDDLRKEGAARLYPELNPEFLRLHNEMDYENKGVKAKVKVPKFAVFSLEIDYMIMCFGKEFWSYKVAIYSPAPKSLKAQLVMSTDLFCDLERPWSLERSASDDVTYNRKRHQLPEEVRDKYSRIGMVQLRAEFRGIVSEEARQNIKKAQNVFLNDIYLAKEVKPAEWTDRHVKGDIEVEPIVLGINQDRCFLIHPKLSNTTSPAQPC